MKTFFCVWLLSLVACVVGHECLSTSQMLPNVTVCSTHQDALLNTFGPNATNETATVCAYTFLTQNNTNCSSLNLNATDEHLKIVLGFYTYNDTDMLNIIQTLVLNSSSLDMDVTSVLASTKIHFCDTLLNLSSAACSNFRLDLYLEDNTTSGTIFPLPAGSTALVTITFEIRASDLTDITTRLTDLIAERVQNASLDLENPFTLLSITHLNIPDTDIPSYLRYRLTSLGFGVLLAALFVLPFLVACVVACIKSQRTSLSIRSILAIESFVGILVTWSQYALLISNTTEMIVTAILVVILLLVLVQFFWTCAQIHSIRDALSTSSCMGALLSAFIAFMDPAALLLSFYKIRHKLLTSVADVLLHNSLVHATVGSVMLVALDGALLGVGHDEWMTAALASLIFQVTYSIYLVVILYRTTKHHHDNGVQFA